MTVSSGAAADLPPGGLGLRLRLRLQVQLRLGRRWHWRFGWQLLRGPSCQPVHRGHVNEADGSQRGRSRTARKHSPRLV